MIVKIDHIGIAVNSVEDVLKLYTDAFGVRAEDIEMETVEAQKVRAAMIPVGESRFELLESTDPEGVIAKYIGRRGEGMHHLALEVSDIQGMLKILKERVSPLLIWSPELGLGRVRSLFYTPREQRC